MLKNTNFETGGYYHIFNRGVDKREIFSNRFDYERFLLSMREFNQTKPVYSLYIKHRMDRRCLTSTNSRGETPTNKDALVQVICYNLLPNHFHFLVRQQQDGGISEFMKRIGGGYTNYFNQNNKRSGTLFQGKFKAVKIDTDEQLLYSSAYINGNAEIHALAKAADWEWGSYDNYLGKRGVKMCDHQIILKEFKDVFDYGDFVKTVISESAAIKAEARKFLFD